MCVLLKRSLGKRVREESQRSSGGRKGDRQKGQKRKEKTSRHATRVCLCVHMGRCVNLFVLNLETQSLCSLDECPINNSVQ